jgi:serine/threonine-protein kinase
VPVPELPGHRFLPPTLLQLLNGLMAKQAVNRIADFNQVRQLLKKAAMENEQNRHPVINTGRKTKVVTKIFKAPTLPPAVKGKKKEVVFTLMGVLLFTAFMMGMWAVFPHNRTDADVPDDSEPAAVLPVDSVAVAAVHKKSAVHAKSLAVPVVHTTPGLVCQPANAADQADAGIDLQNGMYYDDFSDDADSIWETGKDANSEFKFENGKYLIQGFTDSLTYHATVKFNLDIQKNFSISVSASQWGNQPDEAYGLNYCGDTDSDSYFVYYITASGYYSIGSMINGDWQPIVNWTRTTDIHPNSEMNTLSIQKRNNSICFLINDKVEKVLPFTGGYGSCFGLRVDGSQTVAFHQLIIKGHQ